MRKLAPKVALGAGSLALAFLGAEGALRIAGYDPLSAALAGRVQLVRESDDPQRGYELVPLARGTGWGTSIEVNSLGFRGPELALEAPGRTRIVALGDSVTFGNDLACEETWPARLERALREAGQAADVLNLALGGYDTVQEVATLEDVGLVFRPAHVVLGYCVNDVGVVSMSLETPFDEADRANPLYRSRIAQWLHARGRERAQKRALYERNREEAYARAFAGEILPLEDLPEVAQRVEALRRAVADRPSTEGELAARRVPPRWYASENRIGRLRHAFERLAALAERHGFEVTLLLVPYLEDDPLIAQGYGIVRTLAELSGFTVVEPAEEFRAAGFPALRIRAEDPVHPDTRGHELMAGALASELLPRLERGPAPGE
jgi:lysophospholipase L1-like esterase